MNAAIMRTLTEKVQEYLALLTICEAEYNLCRFDASAEQSFYSEVKKCWSNCHIRKIVRTKTIYVGMMLPPNRHITVKTKSI